MAPPDVSAGSEANVNAVLCMSGDAGSAIGPLATVTELDRRGGRPGRPVDVDAADHRPRRERALGDAGHLVHDALRQPGRAARVGEVHAAGPRRATEGRMAADQVLVVRDGRTLIRVAHLDDPAQPRQPGRDLPDAVGEAGVDDHRLRIGVLQELAQLLVAVPVVDVDVHGVELDRGEERLEVLAAVVEVERDLATLTDAGSLQPRRQASGPLVQLAPGAHPAPVDQGDLVRDGVGDRFPDRSEVQFHIGPLQSMRSRPC